MTMRDRMKNGQLFTDMCEGLPQRRSEAKNLMNAFNRADHTDIQTKTELINQMIDAEKDVWIESPFYFIYGKNIHMGEGSFINMNCNFIDDGQIIVGFGGQLVAVHAEAAVAGDVQHAFVGIAGLRADGCAEAEAHGAEAA